MQARPMILLIGFSLSMKKFTRVLIIAGVGSLVGCEQGSVTSNAVIPKSQQSSQLDAIRQPYQDEESVHRLPKSVEWLERKYRKMKKDEIRESLSEKTAVTKDFIGNKTYGLETFHADGAYISYGDMAKETGKFSLINGGVCVHTYTNTYCRALYISNNGQVATPASNYFENVTDLKLLKMELYEYQK